MRFDRKRIYVLPTRFGLFFAVLLIAMALGALNYNNNPALMLGLLLAGAANTSLFAAHLQLSGLSVTAISAEPVPAGAPLPVRVHARAAPGRERRGIRIEGNGADATLSLDDGAGDAMLPIATTRRGWLDLERLRISTTRPLGLARAWAYVWPDAPLLVYPAPESHGPPLPQGSGDNAQARLHPVGDDVHHLRAYRRGDARRAIAWKPSARRGACWCAKRQPKARIRLDWRRRTDRVEEDRAPCAGSTNPNARSQYRLELPGQPRSDRRPGPPHACPESARAVAHVEIHPLICTACCSLAGRRWFAAVALQLTRMMAFVSPCAIAS